MRLAISTAREFDRPADVVFDFTNDAANFTTFAGFGPIPGIRTATYETAGEPAAGSRRRMIKTDGTEHIEEIVRLERPSRHVSKITALSPPFSWLVKSGEDDWRFIASDKGTIVERTFAFELTTPIAAVVAWPLLQLFMRPAVKRDLRNIERRLADL